MTDLSRLRTIEQLEAEQARLEQQADKQLQGLASDTQTIRRTWQKRMAGVERFANIMSLVLPKVGQGTIVVTLLSRLFRRFRR
mgnify:CR=1 FL=1